MEDFRTDFEAMESLIVSTSHGKIRGFFNQCIATFLGIPYGGYRSNRRFMPSEPAGSWDRVRDAFTYGHIAPQVVRAIPPGVTELIANCFLGSEPMSEECLYLNVWTPATDSASRPVMVWLHPGGFSSGSASAPFSDGTRLAHRGDVVVVSVAQRLNIFGYLYLAEIAGHEYADSGNAGQYDLILALRWIRSNIAAFGGDPNNITLFGESGGGCKICTLMAMPEARGLFHKAIVESGPMIKAVSASRATAAAAFVLDSMGLSRSKIENLQHVTMESILAAYANAVKAGYFRAFSPVLDGRGLPRDPFLPDAPDQVQHMPLIIGFNSTETTFLLASEYRLDLSWSELSTALAQHMEGSTPEPIIAAARMILPQASPSDLFLEITSQMMIFRNSVRIAELKAAQKAPVFVYQLAWQTPVDGGRWRSPHALEIPLVFNNVERARALLGAGDTPQILADQISDAWISFARSGDPNGGTLPFWPRYCASGETMVFDVSSRVQKKPTAPIAGLLSDVPYWHCAG